MIAHDRHRALLDLLQNQQRVSVAQLEEHLGVSPATLRRDLAALEAAGRLVRTRGGVAHPSVFRGEASLAQKKRAAPLAKRAMAEAAAALVPSGSTVFVDAGSSCLELGQLLLARPDLVLLTHSIPLAACAYPGGAKVICLGGEVRAVSGAAVGALGLAWTAHLRADWAFLGATGLDRASGAATTELGEAAMKGEFVRRSQRRVLLADGSKWEHPAPVVFAPWSDFDFWVTDAAGQIFPTAPCPALQVVRVERK